MGGEWRIAEILRLHSEGVQVIQSNQGVLWLDPQNTPKNSPAWAMVAIGVTTRLQVTHFEVATPRDKNQDSQENDIVG